MRRFIRASAAAVLLGIAAAAGWAGLTHRISYVVTNGVSMKPLYVAGDLVVVTRRESYHAGDIVAYRYGSIILLHRIIGGGPGGYTTKGDNNQSVDPGHPTASLLLGKAAVHIPAGGIWLHRAASPPGIAILVFCLLMGAGGTVRYHRRARRRRAAGQPRRHGRTPTAMPGPVRQAAAVGIAVMGAAGVVLAVVAWTRPLTQASPVPSRPTQTMTFSYLATVPRTPAYDGTTVRSPDPVFRRVTNHLEVRFSYRGPPGTVRVAAVLSTVSGWHSTVQLVDARPAGGGGYRGVVALDLAVLDARAVAAAVATGVPTGELRVALVPTVTTPGGAPFAPALSLRVTPLLAVATSPFVVSGPTPAATLAHLPRMLGVSGHDLMRVSTARTVAVGLVLDAILDAILFAMLLRRYRPRGEDGRIRARYGQLLVQVQPMSPAADRPVIRVSEFRTMAKLAERYQLLVLYWSTAGAATFVMPDEAVTYWYCTDPAAPVPSGVATRQQQPQLEDADEPPPHWELGLATARDSLTQLANRSLFEGEMQYALDECEGQLPCLMLIDVDHFEEMAREHGPSGADILLIAAAERLRQAIRPRDMVARLDGNHFAVLLEGVTPANVAGISRRVMRTIREPMSLDDTEVTVSASLGIAEARDAEGAGGLMARATAALAMAAASAGAMAYVAWYADKAAPEEGG
jgi:signal peptidase I